MNSHNKDDISQEILIRYVLGELDDTERNAVIEWMNKSRENEKKLSTLQRIVTDIDQFKENADINVDAQWQLFLSNKENGFEKNQVISINKRGYFSKIAICISIVLFSTIGYFIYQHYKSNQYIWLDAGNKICTIQLQDGSSVTLNKGARLGYSRNFLKENRKVELIGEAFFNVKHGAFPTFTVTSDDVLIKDVGTAFNVKSAKRATQIIVEEGKVDVETNNTTLQLSANEMVDYNPSENVLKKSTVNDTFYQYYRTKKFNCNETPLFNLVNGLNDVYGSSIVLKESSLNSIPITVYFEDQPLNKILDIICNTLKLQWTKKTNGQILISKIN